jgi:Type II secretion system (T2SS), protein M subtype b
MGSLALVYFLAVQPLVSLFSDQADLLSQARTMLSGYRVIADREETVRAAAARADEAASSAKFLQGASEGAASASLQARLKAIADQAGARVQSVRALEPATEGSVRYLKAHLELAGPVAAIYTTLRAIEAGEPYLFVAQALLRMPADRQGVLPTQEPSIEAQLDVYGPVHGHAVSR